MLRWLAKAHNDPCPREIVEAFEKKCDDFENCMQCCEHAINAIADTIEQETLQRPLFEDGKPVQFGDDVLVKCQDGDFGGELYQVAFDSEGVTLTNTDGEIAFIAHGERVKRPEPPDSWERVEEDVISGRLYAYMDAEEVVADVFMRCKALAESGARP